MMLYASQSTFACADDSSAIENGTYFAKSGKDRISVEDEKIRFVLTITVSGEQRLLDKSYGYELRSDGRIRPHPVRSADAVFGVGRSKWYWTGGEIVQKDLGTDEVLNRFARRP